MANTPESIAILWQRLQDKKVIIPSDVWAVWQVGCVQELLDIRKIVEQSHGGPIIPSAAEAIGKKAYLVQKFVRSIKRSEDGRTRILAERIYMEDSARELVAHYIGNDLYKVSLIADIYGVNPDPLPPENGELILKNVDSIMDFIELLKRKTGQTA